MFLNEKNERWEMVANSDSCICSPESRRFCEEGVKGREEGGWVRVPGPVEEGGQAKAFAAELKVE